MILDRSKEDIFVSRIVITRVRCNMISSKTFGNVPCNSFYALVWSEAARRPRFVKCIWKWTGTPTSSLGVAAMSPLPP